MPGCTNVSPRDHRWLSARPPQPAGGPSVRPPQPAAGSTLPSVQPLGQYPHPSHTIAHVSDTHLLAGGKLQYGVVDTVQHLELALDRLGRIDPVPQALVFTGDLADRGEPKAYQQLREMVEPFAERLGAQVVWCMGNHDDRESYARGLYRLRCDTRRVRPRLRRRRAAHRGARHERARLPPRRDQRRAVRVARRRAGEPAPHGTFLAMHHPPIPIPMLPAAAIIELDDQQRLADALAGTDVRMILGGHFHYSSYSTLRGHPCLGRVRHLLPQRHRAAGPLHLRGRRRPVGERGARVRRPGRHLGGADPRLARDQRLRLRRRSSRRGDELRGAPRDVLPQGLRVQPDTRTTRSSAPARATAAAAPRAPR